MLRHTVVVPVIEPGVAGVGAVVAIVITLEEALVPQVLLALTL